MGYALEHLVNVYLLVPAYAKRSAVDKADPRAFAKQDLLDKQCHGYGNFSFQFHETVVRDNLGKQMAQMPAHLVQIEMLQAASNDMIRIVYAMTIKGVQGDTFCMESTYCRPVYVCFA